MIAIGVGCRKGCSANEIVTLVREALAALPEPCELAGLFSISTKADETGLAAAAAVLGLPLAFFEAERLRVFAERTSHRSDRVAALHGLPNVAETAALAGAGNGAVLLVSRMTTPRATCAIAGPRQRP